MRWIGTVTNVSTNYTASESDVMILANATDGAITVTLPTALGLNGRVMCIKKTAGLNNVTVDAAGSETIDGALTNILSTLWSSILLVSDGTNWFIV